MVCVGDRDATLWLSDLEEISRCGMRAFLSEEDLAIWMLIKVKRKRSW